METGHVESEVDHPMSNTLDTVDVAGIAEILGVSRKHVTDRLSKHPSFPAPVIAISRKTRRWLREAIMEWAGQGAQQSRRA
jgi:predicted DNA-binding transcriptional regulator AlpA